MPTSIRAGTNLYHMDWLIFRLSWWFAANMLMCSPVFGRSHDFGVYAFGTYCDRRHAQGAVKTPAHMPNLAVLALSSSTL